MQVYQQFDLVPSAPAVPAAAVVPSSPKGLVDLAAVCPEISVSVLQRVHGSSLWQPVETGDRIRVAPRIGKNLKVVLSSQLPIFDYALNPSGHQVFLIQNSQYEPMSHSALGCYRVCDDDSGKSADLHLAHAPLQPVGPLRLEFDVKLFILHKGLRFMAKVQSPMTGQIYQGYSVEFVAHNSGRSRDPADPKRAKSKPKRERKTDHPNTPPTDDDSGTGTDSSYSPTHSPGGSFSVYDTAIYPVPTYYQPMEQPQLQGGDQWAVIDSNLFVEGQTRAASYSQYSDVRLKTDIDELTSALETVSKLAGKRYRWLKDSPEAGSTIGLIAQQVQRVAPELVHTTDDGWLTVEYSALVPLIVEALKTQMKNLEFVKSDLLARLELLASQQEQLVDAVAKLRTRVAAQVSSPQSTPTRTKVHNSGKRPPKKSAAAPVYVPQRSRFLGCVVVSSLVVILLALVMFLGLWFGWRAQSQLSPAALLPSPSSTTNSNSNNNNNNNNNNNQNMPNTPSSNSPSSSPSPSGTVSPVGSATPSGAATPAGTTPTGSTPSGSTTAPAPISWQNGNYLDNGGYENPDPTTPTAPASWSSSGNSVSYYDYNNSTSAKRAAMLDFSLILNATQFYQGQKAMRFTRTVADRLAKRPVPSIVNSVPLKEKLNLLATLHGLSLTSLLSGLQSARVSVWVNWMYAPNNTNPAVSGANLYPGTVKLQLSKRVTVLGLSVKVSLASVSAPLSLANATGPPEGRNWFKLETNLLFNILALPDILDVEIICDMIGDVFVDASALEFV